MLDAGWTQPSAAKQVVCCYCSRVLEVDGAWREVPGFDPESSQEVDSHGICPTCYDEHALPMLERLTGLIPGIENGPTRLEARPATPRRAPDPSTRRER